MMHGINTRDVVESAIDARKCSRGTWGKIIQRGRIKRWVDLVKPLHVAPGRTERDGRDDRRWK